MEGNTADVGGMGAWERGAPHTTVKESAITSVVIALSFAEVQGRFDAVATVFLHK